MLNVIDEFTHECLAIRVDRKLKAVDVIDVLSDLFILRGVPRPRPLRQRARVRRQGRAGLDRGGRCHDRPTSSPAAPFRATAVALIPAGPDRQLCCRWENGYFESFNASSGMSCSTARSSTRCGGPGRDRELAAALQHRPSTLLARLQAAGTTGLRPGILREAGCAGARASVKLTFQLDHSMKADQT